MAVTFKFTSFTILALIIFLGSAILISFNVRTFQIKEPFSCRTNHISVFISFEIDRTIRVKMVF